MSIERFDSPSARITISLAAALVMLFIAAAVHDEQLEVFGSPPYVFYLVRQVFYESPGQPFYLILSVAPVAAAAWIGVSWTRLIAGGLPLVSTVLPYGAFLYIRISSGELVGYHTSLHQLAAPLHEMWAIMPGYALIFAGGLIALFWRSTPGALISAIGLVATAIGWTVTERAGDFVIDSRALMSFPTSPLLFGYYVAWVGVAVGVAKPARDRWNRVISRKSA